MAVSQSKADKPHLRINHRFLCLQPVTTLELKADVVGKEKNVSRCNISLVRPKATSQPQQVCCFWQGWVNSVSSLKCQASSPRSSDHLSWVDTSVKLSTQVEKILESKPYDWKSMERCTYRFFLISIEAFWETYPKRGGRMHESKLDQTLFPKAPWQWQDNSHDTQWITLSHCFHFVSCSVSMLQNPHLQLFLPQSFQHVLLHWLAKEMHGTNEWRYHATLAERKCKHSIGVGICWHLLASACMCYNAWCFIASGCLWPPTWVSRMDARNSPQLMLPEASLSTAPMTSKEAESAKLAWTWCYDAKLQCSGSG